MQEGNQLINSFEEASTVVMDNIQNAIWKAVWERLNNVQIHFEVKINVINGTIQEILINEFTP